MNMTIEVEAWSHDWHASLTLALAAYATLVRDVKVGASAETLKVSMYVDVATAPQISMAQSRA